MRGQAATFLDGLNDGAAVAPQPRLDLA
jgi:hypothetical protein